MGIREDAFGDDFLQELATTFQKADGSVCLGEAIVRFVGFGDDDHDSLLPRMVSQRDHSVEDLEESVWTGLEGPFKEFIIDPGATWS